MELDTPTTTFEHVIRPLVDEERYHNFCVGRCLAVHNALRAGQIKRHAKGGCAADGADAYTVCKVTDRDGRLMGVGYSFWTRSHDRPVWRKTVAEAIARGRVERVQEVPF